MSEKLVQVVSKIEASQNCQLQRPNLEEMAEELDDFLTEKPNLAAIMETDFDGFIEKLAHRVYSLYKQFARYYQDSPSLVLCPYRREDSPGLYKKGDYFEKRNRNQIMWYCFDAQGRGELELHKELFEKKYLLPLLKDSTSHFKSGSLKTTTSISERIAVGVKEHRDADYVWKNLNDVARGRLIAPSVCALEKILAKIYEELGERIVQLRNMYRQPAVNIRQREIKFHPYIGINIVFDMLPVIPYELQLMTRRSEVVGELNHGPFRKRNIELPKAELEYIEALSWMSHLIDAREYVQDLMRPNEKPHM